MCFENNVIRSGQIPVGFESKGQEQVLADGSGKEDGLLLGIGDLAAQEFRRVLCERGSVEQDFAGRGLFETAEQTEKG